MTLASKRPARSFTAARRSSSAGLPSRRTITSLIMKCLPAAPEGNSAPAGPSMMSVKRGGTRPFPRLHLCVGCLALSGTRAILPASPPSPGQRIVTLRLLARIFALAVVPLFAAGPARAQESVAEFYRGRVVNIIVGFAVGAGYDVHGRLMARHMGKHIPGNPTVIPLNMEGAGSLKLVN